MNPIIDDALFASMAAIGFASISHTPVRNYIICAIAAAAGHSLRFALMEGAGINIIPASTIAAFAVGLIAVIMAPLAKVPAEACLFPALLPMIPGMYAYKAIRAMIQCATTADAMVCGAPLCSLVHNGLTCSGIILGLVLGANLPIFMLKKISFQATR